MNESRYAGLEDWDQHSTRMTGPIKFSSVNLKGESIQSAEGLATLGKLKVQSVVIASVSILLANPSHLSSIPEGTKVFLLQFFFSFFFFFFFLDFFFLQQFQVYNKIEREIEISYISPAPTHS